MKPWLALAAVLAIAPVVGAQEPSLAELMEKTAHYVRAVERGFASVIGDESSTQTEHLVRGSGTSARPTDASRHVDSETLFQWMPSQRAWITIRNVLRVDGRAVADSRMRLETILARTDQSDVTTLRQLRDESARYNLGGIHRNFNDPMLPFLFVDPDAQPRFSFTLDAPETIDGFNVWKVQFAERGEPTFIEMDNAPALSHGAIWITASGIVVRTQLELEKAVTRLHASITVTYAPSRSVGGWVPVRMDERYSEAPADAGPEHSITEQIVCQTTYANYRRFETSARVLVPKQFSN